ICRLSRWCKSATHRGNVSGLTPLGAETCGLYRLMPVVLGRLIKTESRPNDFCHRRQSVLRDMVETPLQEKFKGCEMTTGQRTILITGAAGGLGKAMVAAFASLGDRVLAADLEPAMADECAQFESLVKPVALDVTDENQWQALFEAAERNFDGIDVLVNNAGYFRPNIAFEDMPLAEWQRHFAINSDGVFLGC